MNKSVNKKPIDDTFVTTNYQIHFEGQPPELTNIVSAEEWINTYITDYDRGFKKESLFIACLRQVSSILLKIYEGILGQPLYVKAHDRDFLGIEPRFYKIIQELKEENVIDSVSRQSFPPDLPAIPAYNFNLNPIQKPKGGHIVLTGSCSGSGFSSEEALAKALVETIERYSLCYWSHKKVIHGSFYHLRGERATDPFIFKVFSEKQLLNKELKEFHYYDRHTPFDWIEGRSFISGQKCFVPAQLVYIGYEGSINEPRICETTTSGAAAGDSWERATFSAICESIERDAFMIFWLNKIAPPKIDITTIENKQIQEIFNRFRRHNIEIRIFDITTDVQLPIFLVVAIDRTGAGPSVYISAASELDTGRALLHGLLEILRIGPRISLYINRYNFNQIKKQYHRILSVKDRAAWWGRFGTTKDIEWMLKGDTRSMPLNNFSNKSYADKLKVLKKYLINIGQEVYLVDASSPVARRYGLFVIKSLIPGFCPLYLDENYKYLGVKRLYDLPLQLGYLKEAKKEEDMNILPHPML